MVLSPSETAAHYRQGIDLFGGYATYSGCGDRKNSGFLAVAQCLQNAKKTKTTTETMVQKYTSRAGAGGA